jgi:hypothetical protein
VGLIGDAMSVVGLGYGLLSFWDYIIVLMIQKVLITQPAALITKGTQSAEGVLRGWPRFRLCVDAGGGGK